MKRIFRLVLAFILLIGAVPVTPVLASSNAVYLGKDIMASKKGNIITEHYSPTGGTLIMGGMSYLNGISTTASAGGNIEGRSAAYDLGGRFTMLSGVYGVIDGITTNTFDGGTTTIAFTGDGKLLSQLDVKAWEMPEPFSVDVTGVQQLTISFSHTSALRFAIADVILTVGAPSQPPLPRSPELGAIAYLGQDVKAYQNARPTRYSEYPDGGSFIMAGTSYYRGVSGDGNWMSAYYNIDGQYTVLSGKYAQIERSTLADGNITTIYGDGRILDQFAENYGDVPIEFSVDVTGVHQLVISFSSSGRSAFADAVFTDSTVSAPPAIENKHSDWATEELTRAAELDLIPDSLKDPGIDYTLPIYRHEFAGVVVKLYERLSGNKVTPAASNPFTDTPAMVAPDVLKAYGAGLMVGVSPDTFAPYVLLNREQAATSLTRAFKLWHFEGWSFASDANFNLRYQEPPQFADHEKISGWAKDSVYFMVANEIIFGVGSNMFAPRATTSVEEAAGYATATREQALIIALRMIENLG